MLEVSDGQRRQLAAWFASGRRVYDELTFNVSAETVFAEPVKGAALGVDFVEASKPVTLVDLGPAPRDGFRRPVRVLRIEQRMTSIGGAVWDCGRVAAALLHRLPECDRGRFAPGTRVLELGTGTGVVGIACWLRGATVTLTDTPMLEPLARRNAQTLGADDRLDVRPLVWGTDVPEPPFDIVLASDCLYDANALPAMLDTLLKVTDAASVVYLVYKRRIDDRERPFFLQLERHFATVAFSNDHLRGVHLCRLARKFSSV